MPETNPTPTTIDRRLVGDPLEIGDRTVQPVARMRGRVGAGGLGHAKPCGVIKITPDGVSFEPTANPLQIPLAGILMAAWSVFWITLTVRAFVRK